MFNKAAKSDAEEEALFLEAGKRLNGWMKNARAYYPEARPKIIELLETAGRTIATLSRLSPGVPSSYSPRADFCPTLHSRRTIYDALVVTLFDHVNRYQDDGELFRRALTITGLTKPVSTTQANLNAGTSIVQTLSSSLSSENSPKQAEKAEASQPAIESVSSPSHSTLVTTATNGAISSQPAIKSPVGMGPSTRGNQDRPQSSNDSAPPSPVQATTGMSKISGGSTSNTAPTSSTPPPSLVTPPPSTGVPTDTRPKKPPLIIASGRRLSAIGSPLATSFTPGGASPVAQSPAQSGSTPGHLPRLKKDRSASGQASASSSSRTGAVALPSNAMPPPASPLSAIGKGKAKVVDSSTVSAHPSLPTPPPTASSSVTDARTAPSASPTPDHSIARTKKKPKLVNTKLALPTSTRGYQPWELADLNWFQSQKGTSTASASSEKGPSVPPKHTTNEFEHVKLSPSTPTISFPEQSPLKETPGDVLERAIWQIQDVEMQDASDTGVVPVQDLMNIASSSKIDNERNNAVQMDNTSPRAHEDFPSRQASEPKVQEPIPLTPFNAPESAQEAGSTDKPTEMQIDDVQRDEITAVLSSSNSDKAVARAQSSLSAMSLSPSPSFSTRSLGFFDPDNVVLVSFNVGMTTGQETVFEFEMNERQDFLLNEWKTRVDHDKSTQHAMCLSLACYAKDDVGSIPTDDEEQLRKSLPRLTPKWPTNARLQAFIGTVRTFLAPPMLLTDEKFVDISSYVQDKNVTVRIEYHADYSDYLFALYCHPPTPSQLRDLDERREKEKKWHDFLFDIKKPFAYGELFGTLSPKF